MDPLIRAIPLEGVLLGAVIAAILILVALKKVEWLLALHLAYPFWDIPIVIDNYGFLWLTTPAVVLAAVLRWGPGLWRGTPLGTPRGWIVPWFGMLLVVVAVRGQLYDGDLVAARSLVLQLLAYALLPCMILWKTATSSRLLRTFMASSIVFTIFGAWLALQRAELTLSSWLSNPFFTGFDQRADQWLVFSLGVRNYHFFAYGFQIATFFGVSLTILARSTALRVLAALVTGLSLYFVFLSQSRQTTASTVFGILALVLLLLKSRMGQRMRYGVLLASALGGLAFWVYRGQSTIVLRGFTSLTEAYSLSSRIGNWRDGIDQFLRTPLIGDGFQGTVSLGHNFFISMGANLGVVGLGFLAGLVAVLWGIFSDFWHTRFVAEERRILAWTFVVTALAVFANAQVSGSPLTVWALYWSATVVWRLVLVERTATQAWMPSNRRGNAVGTTAPSPGGRSRPGFRTVRPPGGDLAEPY